MRVRFPRLDRLMLAIENWRYRRGQRIIWTDDGPRMKRRLARRRTIR